MKHPLLFALALSSAAFTGLTSAVADAPPASAPALMPVDQIPVPPPRLANSAVAANIPATQPAVSLVRAAPNRIVILPFAAIGDGGHRDWVASAVQQSLAADVARIGGLSPITAPAPPGLIDAADACAAARNRGGDTVVFGSFQFIDSLGAANIAGAQVRFAGEVVSVDGARVLAGLKVSGDFRDLFSLEDELGSQISRALRAASAPAQPTAAPTLASANSEIFAGEVPTSAPNYYAPLSDAARYADQYNRYYYQQTPDLSGLYGGYSSPYSYGGVYPGYGYGFNGGFGQIIVVNHGGGFGRGGIGIGSHGGFGGGGGGHSGGR